MYVFKARLYAAFVDCRPWQTVEIFNQLASSVLVSSETTAVTNSLRSELCVTAVMAPLYISYVWFMQSNRLLKLADTQASFSVLPFLEKYILPLPNMLLPYFSTTSPTVSSDGNHSFFSLYIAWPGIKASIAPVVSREEPTGVSNVCNTAW